MSQCGLDSVVKLCPVAHFCKRTKTISVSLTVLFI